MADDGKPGRDCARCPRLAAFRKKWRAVHPTWFNAPVPSFGPLGAHVLIIGLAPGLQGANRTGRPFTGDYAGVLLYETLIRYGFARGTYAAHPDDGLNWSIAALPTRCVAYRRKTSRRQPRLRPAGISSKLPLPR